VILLDDGSGNIILANATGDQSPYPLVLGENILSSNTSYDFTDRFYKYIVLSQSNPIGGQTDNVDLLGITDLREREALIDSEAEADQDDETTVETTGEAIDTDIRESRILYLNAENPSSPEDCKKRAEWELNIRKARSRSYNCKLQGHTHAEGVPVTYNTLHQVVDGVAGINDIMLISQVDYSESENGTGVALTLVDRNSYTLKNEKPAKQEKTSKEGDDYGAGDEEAE
jgi:prophage tail gpP-like protein